MHVHTYDLATFYTNNIIFLLRFLYFSLLQLQHMILWHQLIVTLTHHWHYKEEGIHEDHKTLGLVSPVHGIHSRQ